MALTKRNIRVLVCFPMVIFLVASCTVSSTYRPVPVEGELTLSLIFHGIQQHKGVLRVAVYNNQQGWLKEDGMVRGRMALVQGEQQRITVTGLPEGSYAVAFYHDVNNNNKFDKYAFIFPAEPYGFSNNVGRFGPPSFDSAKFMLNTDITLTLNLN